MNGLGFSRDEVLTEVGSIENLLTLLPDVPAIYPVWKQIVRDHRVPPSFDVCLVSFGSVRATAKLDAEQHPSVLALPVIPR